MSETGESFLLLALKGGWGVGTKTTSINILLTQITDSVQDYRYKTTTENKSAYRAKISQIYKLINRCMTDLLNVSTRK